MSEDKSKIEEKKTSRFNWNSKFWRVSLTLLSAFLTFGGPYVVLALFKALDLDYVVSMVSGFIVFLVGLVLMLFLIKKKVVS
ncbi:hypothetical protein C0199_01580 [Candidatus Bathyarchaeota archaeon]|nr:MAG: hypothetical protein C0199_01580 [Candidatus Bathyarchaeota archaeon]